MTLTSGSSAAGRPASSRAWSSGRFCRGAASGLLSVMVAMLSATSYRMNSVCMLVSLRGRRSLALPARRSLLGEGSGALARVLRPEHRRHDVHLLLPALLLGPVEAATQDLLGRGEGERPVGGDRGGKLQRAAERRTRLDQAVDEAVVVRRLGGQRVTGQRELHGDVVRQPL